MNQIEKRSTPTLTKPSHAINVKILYHTSPNLNTAYYTIAVGKMHKARACEVRGILDNQTGRGFICNLIELLTQDPVLEAISPVARKVTS